MQVSPEELRKAAATVDGFADKVGKAPVRDGEPLVDTVAGVLRGGPAIAAALHTVDPAMKKAVTVATGRYQEVASIFRTSADEYHGTDMDSAARFDAIGDLNSGVAPA
ncbi:type VII secretion target [Nocardia sp. NBC_01388]|uniref:type VII secretion target n=1 Tax=Nocardia sp. NBC_01388 TaxID=2903596 RepID=UPI003247FE29